MNGRCGEMCVAGRGGNGPLRSRAGKADPPPGSRARHLLAGRDIDGAQDYNRNPLGTGPYRVAEWKTGEYVLLERVSGYWRGDSLPAIRRLLFRFIANTTTRMNQLRSGEVHVTALVPWDKYREVKDVPGLSIHRMPGNSYEHVTLNQRSVEAFRDVRVRHPRVAHPHHHRGDRGRGRRPPALGRAMGRRRSGGLGVDPDHPWGLRDRLVDVPRRRRALVRC